MVNTVPDPAHEQPAGEGLADEGLADKGTCDGNPAEKGPVDEGPVDAIGRRHAVAGDNARIVSLVPSLTELLVDLGLGQQLVGRTGFCIHPREVVRAIPKVGGTKDVKLDEIRRLKASHVIVNVDENRREDADALIDMGVQVIATHPQTPEDNRALYALLGSIFARDQEAARLTGGLDDALAIDAAAGAPDPVRVLYLIWRDPWMSVSADTYVANMLRLGGMEVVAANARDRYPVIADHEPAWQRADAVLLASEPYPFREKHLKEVQEAVGGAGKTVRLVDGELLSWYGSRAIAGIRYARQLGSELQA